MADVSDTADSGTPVDPHCWRPWTFAGMVESLNAVGTLCILAVMILINFDIFGRFLFSSPVPGVKEMVELSIVGIVFLQLPHALRAGRITRSDAAFSHLLRRYPRVAHTLSALYNLTGSLLAVLIAYGSVPRFTRAWAEDHYVGNQGIFVAPVWPVRLIIVIGCICLFIQFALFLWRDLRLLRGGERVTK